MKTEVIAALFFVVLSGVAAPGDEAAAPQPFATDFEKDAIGELPDGMMEIDGTFTVEADGDANRALKMSENPLGENAVLLGPNFEGAGTVEAKIRAEKKRRSFPRFGIGVHGISGYRLRVVPSTGIVELVKAEEAVETVPFEWKPDVWSHLKLEIRESGGKWIVSGWVWPEGGEQPEKPTIRLETDEKPGRGKASFWGTPYSGKPVWYDDVKITPGQSE